MAGMFGLFDPTKEGKGVKKEEKKKKCFFAFWETYFRYFWSYMLVGATYWVTSALLVTNGFAKAGFTHIVRSTNRGKHSFMLDDYFDTIKKNWKQTLGLGILNAVITAVLVLDVYYFYNQLMTTDGVFAIFGLGVALFLAIAITFMKYYIWTMAITFNLTVKQLIKNSFHFVFLNLWRNILISAVLGLIYSVILFFLITTQLHPFVLVVSLIYLVLIFPGFKTSLIQANVFPSIKKYIIDPYYAEHKGEDIEKRRALGLDIAEDELPPEEHKETGETLFTDVVLENTENNKNKSPKI